MLIYNIRLAPAGTVKKKSASISNESTLPWLELLGVVTGVHAANFIVKELKLLISERYLWTDFECVLHWLKTLKLLPLPVENRNKVIRLQKDITFCYYFHQSKILLTLQHEGSLFKKLLTTNCGGMDQNG